MKTKLMNLIEDYKKTSIALLVAISLLVGQFGLHLGNFLQYGDKEAFKFTDPMQCMGLAPVAQAVMQGQEFGVPKVVVMQKMKEWLEANPENVIARVMHFASEVYDGRGDPAFEECVAEAMKAQEKAARSQDPKVNHKGSLDVWS